MEKSHSGLATAFGGVPLKAVMRTPEINMFYTYIIQSEKTNRYYIGFTSNIESRLKKHNAGEVRSTKYGIPWKLIYKESFEKKNEAWKREQQIKKYKGGKAFKLLIGEVA